MVERVAAAAGVLQKHHRSVTSPVFQFGIPLRVAGRDIPVKAKS